MLAKIIEAKKKFLEEKIRNFPLRELKEKIKEQERKEQNFYQALKQEHEIKIIAEVKRSSPSRGVILKKDSDIVKIASIYEANGAVAISVLTENCYFKTTNEDFLRIRDKVKLPLLRKDFIIDEYEIYESSYLGASALLLIVRILDDFQLEGFYNLALSLGLEPLLEVHDKDDLEKALRLSPKLVGINNRDLDTLEVDIACSEKLLPLLPVDCVKVCESGIRSYQDIQYLRSLGADAFLIGEALLLSDDIGKKLRELQGYDTA